MAALYHPQACCKGAMFIENVWSLPSMTLFSSSQCSWEKHCLFLSVLLFSVLGMGFGMPKKPSSMERWLHHWQHCCSYAGHGPGYFKSSVSHPWEFFCSSVHLSSFEQCLKIPLFLDSNFMRFFCCLSTIKMDSYLFMYLWPFHITPSNWTFLVKKNSTFDYKYSF